MNEPTRCRIHSRATKIGQRMWKRNALCSNGVPCRSRIRKRISPSSDSSISSLLPRERDAGAVDDREVARHRRRRAARTRGRGRGSCCRVSLRSWRPPGRASVAARVVVAVTAACGPFRAIRRHTCAGDRLRTGPPASPTPPGSPGSTRPGRSRATSCASTSSGSTSVELNTTGYRLPDEERVPALGRGDADRLPVRGEDAAPEPATLRVGTFCERVRCSATGSVRFGSSSSRPATTAGSRCLLESLDPELRVRVRVPPRVLGRRRVACSVVNALDGDAPFRYLRLREPPYRRAELRGVGGTARPAPRRRASGSTSTSSTRTSRSPRRTPRRLLELLSERAG